jgi:CHAT domain-containing protein/tetratricopeptide (TPR) repeat protein
MLNNEHMHLKEDECLHLFISWLHLPTNREKLHFLEAHLELLAFRSDQMLLQCIAQYAEENELLQISNEHLKLLRDVSARGDTIEAVRQTYVDKYSGFILDLPPWLENIKQQLIDLSHNEEFDDIATESERLIYEAIVRAQSDESIAPEICATFLTELGNVLEQNWYSDPSVYDAILEVYQEALQVFLPSHYPLQYAQIQYRLGNIYLQCAPEGNTDSQEQAITCYKSALTVYTCDTFPYKWTMTQSYLGSLFQERIAGEPEANLEEAIGHYETALQAFSSETYPEQWGILQNNLGNAYADRIAGKKEENLEHTIAAYEAALLVFTYDAFPVQWATTLLNLGTTYREQIAGERSANLERALSCFESALQVFTQNTHPEQWAATLQNKLGPVYRERVIGERRLNIEQAIHCYEQALQVRTRDLLPLEWATLQNNLGAAYVERLEGTKKQNLEQAIEYFQTALQIYTADTFPLNYAKIQNNLGSAYIKRKEGAKRQNLERAITCCKMALQIYTKQSYPQEYAMASVNLGAAYVERIDGKQQENLELAITCYKAASQVYTRETFPLDYAWIQYNLGATYTKHVESMEREQQKNLEQAIACYKTASQIYAYDMFPIDHRESQIRIAKLEAQRGNWIGVHKACQSAYTAENLLVLLGGNAVGRNTVLEGEGSASILDGFALTRLCQIEAAALAMEQGRARGLAEALALDRADSRRIGDTERREKYETVHQAVLSAQKEMYTSSLSHWIESERRHVNLERAERHRKVQEDFHNVIMEIRAAQDPIDFLEDIVDSDTIARAVAYGGPGHRIVYLAATPWGGIALSTGIDTSDSNCQPHFSVLDLPPLTERFVNTLIETKLDDDVRHTIGGFSHAQEDNGFSLIVRDWSGKTFEECARNLHSACLIADKTSTLDAAAQKTLAIPMLQHLATQPIDDLSDADMATLALTLSHYFLQLELQLCMKLLGDTVLSPVITWLQEQGTTSVTFIPCGMLTAFPLIAIPVDSGQTVGDTLPSSIAPSARSLLHDKRAEEQRSGIYALGDPHPSHQKLLFGEAEAFTLVKQAHNIGLLGEAQVQKKATRTWLIQALQKGIVVAASCHGKFSSKDFLQSSLLLAKGQRLTLGDMLSHEADLRGLRLLILSACQTSILHLRGARDEVHSLSAGAVQAGAMAVLGSLWKVDEIATYLLMVRFAKEWFPQLDHEPPAAALARAQYWLRTATRQDLQEWYATDLLILVHEKSKNERLQSLAYRSWLKEGQEPTDEEIITMGRRHSNRYDAGEAEDKIREMGQIDDDTFYPYADPVYWAGFQITGW